MRWIALLAGLTCIAWQRGAAQGRVSGRIAVLEKKNKPSPDLSSAVVYLEGAGPPAPPVTVQIAINDKEFVPRVVVVPLGSTVRFPNHDPFDHNVFSASDPNQFDLGQYGRGEAKGRTFTSPGLVRVFCNIHPRMVAFVLVTVNRLSAQPAADGTFVIDDVAPGAYMLHAWHERAPEVVRHGVQAFLSGRTATFAGMSAVSAQVPQFRERLLRGSERGNVLDQAEEYRQLLGAAWVLVTDDHGILVARTDYPTETDIDLSRGALVANALSGEPTNGAWLDDRLRRLFEAVAVPLRASANAAPQGVLIAAYAVDDNLAQAIKQATTTDVVFFALDSLDRPYIVGSTLPREEVEPALVADTAAIGALGGGGGGGRDSTGAEFTADVGGERLIGLASPLRSAGGDVFGGFITFRSHDRELAAFRTLQRTIGFAVVLGLLLALASAYVLARQIAGPIRRLALATRQVQDGDYSIAIEARSGDEIGMLSQAFQQLVADLKEKADLVEYMTSVSRAAPTEQLAPPSPRPSVASRGDVLRPGTLFASRYEVKELLGTGGMGDRKSTRL